MLHQSKLKYIIRASLACGVMITAVALSGCSGSEKAVQANAPVMSSGVTSTDPNSAVPSSNSEIVSSTIPSSSSAPSVSSAVAVNGGVVSKPSSGTTSTSHQAPTSKPSGGTVSTKPASTVTKPASKPASTPTKPESKPTSTAPASKPVSTAPVDNGSFSAKYYGATYGCSDKSQYNYVLEHANVVGSSRYNSAHSTWEGNQDSFESMNGVPYSDDWNNIVSIRACFGSGGSGSSSGGSAYDFFTGANRMCADKAKAFEAALHVAGYNARLAGGTENGGSHMWVQIYKDGSWWNLDGHISTSLNPGYSLSSTGYNL